MNLGKIKDRKITLIGGAGFIGHNLALHLQKLGAEVMLCGPKTLMPKFMNEFGVIIENDIKKALKWCDVANVLRIQLERQKVKYFPSLREYSLYFGINKKLLERGLRMDRGYGKLRGKAFRVAHMGNVMREDLTDYLNNFDEVING